MITDGTGNYLGILTTADIEKKLSKEHQQRSQKLTELRGNVLKMLTALPEYKFNTDISFMEAKLCFLEIDNNYALHIHHFKDENHRARYIVYFISAKHVCLNYKDFVIFKIQVGYESIYNLSDIVPKIYCDWLTKYLYPYNTERTIEQLQIENRDIEMHNTILLDINKRQK